MNVRNYVLEILAKIKKISNKNLKNVLNKIAKYVYKNEFYACNHYQYLIEAFAGVPAVDGTKDLLVTDLFAIYERL